MVRKILHTPNHRIVKGTEFLIASVKELRAEGLKVELDLLEGVSNNIIRSRMREADILADQFVLTGYALSACEGMASGLPVMSNVENETLTRVFRRYSFLDECPILSTSPESLKSNLRALVTRPKLREELGRAGRAFIEKYHSIESGRYLFRHVYDRLLHGSTSDLMNLYHPLHSPHVNLPRIEHRLCENRLVDSDEIQY